jgi:RNA polymerase sigma-70 factor (sigma-E family)
VVREHAVSDRSEQGEPLEVVEPLDPGATTGIRAGATEGPALRPMGLVAPAGSFADFYRDTYAEMVRLAYLLTGSRETACDLVQDSFVRVHAAWHRTDEPRAYLRRSVVNACHSHHRRQRVRRRHLAAQRVETVDLVADEISDAIARLPYRQRTAIVLRYWHDCTEAEIASALGCRPGTVGALVHRAHAALRKVIEP